ncbi:MAG TPA: two-component system response regulator CreB [Pseudomonas sabulinigri]|uniref:Two-component system response regulator CreB n=1 Tax=marine sediment metagenome TaxID=412755 RepID=A0A0F9VSV8_9ZZZZ|nr:two-component system response regulator CreB [Halopseudomonas sabulinigri]HEC51798.1 two-component system response regulator CreB [Halopseudomonas sabulinigri]
MGDKILIIEDEPAIADALLYALTTEGFEAHWCGLARDGMSWLKQNPVDLVVLDVGLPDESGFELCRRIRQFSAVPIMFLTARKEEVDRIVGLEIGADDYVVKPFSPREISARVRAILRRARPSAPTSDSLMEPLFAHDEERKRIRYHQQWLELTRYEYLILSALLRHPEHILSRDQLMDAAWNDPAASLDRVIDTHIKGIRTKLKKILPSNDPIVTHRGLGYSIELSRSEPAA